MPRRNRLFSYDFENFSAKDIIKYVEGLGYKVTFDEKSYYGRFVINGTNIEIRVPEIDSVLESDFALLFSATGSLLWQNYSNTYFTPESIERGAYDERLENLYDEHEQLFKKLKRKFGMKKGMRPKAIKDLEWIRSLKTK